MSEKLDINKKMVGKDVLVIDSVNGNWTGIVEDVKDEFTFLVYDGNRNVEVDIYDLRSIE